MFCRYSLSSACDRRSVAVDGMRVSGDWPDWTIEPLYPSVVSLILVDLFAKLSPQSVYCLSVLFTSFISCLYVLYFIFP